MCSLVSLDLIRLWTEPNLEKKYKWERQTLALTENNLTLCLFSVLTAKKVFDWSYCSANVRRKDKGIKKRVQNNLKNRYKKYKMLFSITKY